jgi:hypothetical protein
MVPSYCEIYASDWCRLGLMPWKPYTDIKVVAHQVPS